MRPLTPAERGAQQSRRAAVGVDGPASAPVRRQGPTGNEVPGWVRRTGDVMTGPLWVPAGSATAPGLRVGSTAMGLFSSGSGLLDVTIGGVQRYGFRTDHFVPLPSGAVDLGRTDWRWRDAWLAGNLHAIGWVVSQNTVECWLNLQTRRDVVADVQNTGAFGWLIGNRLQLRDGGESEVTISTARTVRPRIDAESGSSVGTAARRFANAHFVNSPTIGSDVRDKADLEPVDADAAADRVRRVASTATITYRRSTGDRRHAGFDAGKVGEIHGEASAAVVDPSVDADRRVNPWRGRPPKDWVLDHSEDPDDPASREEARQRWRDRREEFDAETAELRAAPLGLRIEELVPDLYAALAAALDRIDVLEARLAAIEG